VAFDLDAVAAQVGLRHIAYVVAVVGIRRPSLVAGLQALCARLGGAGEVLDLYAGIVVVELALHVPPVRGHDAGDAVADHARAAVADMQRPGRVGRHVFHAHRLAVAAGVAPEAIGGNMDVAHLLLPGGRREMDIDEAGTREFDLRDGVRGGQGVDQVLRQRARIGLRPALAKLAGQQHRRIGREVAVRALLRSLDHELGRGKVDGQGAGGTQGGQALFDQGAELGFHEGSGSRFNGCALYARRLARRFSPPTPAAVQCVPAVRCSRRAALAAGHQ
jgi:hypothetical protein